MMRLMPWGFNLMERKPVSKYRDVIEHLRDLYVLHVYSRLRVDNEEVARMPKDDGYIQSDLDFKMLEAMGKVIRRTVSEDVRGQATIYENDFFVVVDPSAFFKQLNEELEKAHIQGRDDGLRYAENNGWKPDRGQRLGI
jgi:hypothetical protein